LLSSETRYHTLTEHFYYILQSSREVRATFQTTHSTRQN